MDLSKVAQALGLTMPTDTEADVPRDEEVGIRNEGGTDKYLDESKNTAKKIKGTAAGSTIQDEEIADGPKRGVEVIKPKESKKSAANGIKKKAAEVSINMTDDEVAAFEAGLNPEQLRNFRLIMQQQEAEGQMPVEEMGDLVGEPSNEEVIGESIVPQPESFNLAKKTKVTVKKAQQTANPSKTEPVDAIQEEKTPGNSEDSLDIPRDKSKAKPEIDVKRPDVDKPTEIRETNYNLGPGATNLHNNAVVPRDGSGDGIGGGTPKFDEESGDKQTSGNPDGYVQDFKEGIDANPAGNKDNHGATGVNSAAAEGNMKKEALSKVSQALGIDIDTLEANDENEGYVLVYNPETDKVYKVE